MCYHTYLSGGWAVWSFRAIAIEVYTVKAIHINLYYVSRNALRSGQNLYRNIILCMAVISRLVPWDSHACILFITRLRSSNFSEIYHQHCMDPCSRKAFLLSYFLFLSFCSATSCIHLPSFYSTITPFFFIRPN